MNGSDKQIKWAIELKQMVLESIEAMRIMVTSHNDYLKFKDQADKQIKMWDDRAEMLEKCNSSVHIIEFFKGFTAEKTDMLIMQQLTSVYKCHANNGYIFK